MKSSLDYGALYCDPLFAEVFPGFNELQQQAATEICKILERCGVDPGMPAIDCIVDLGCGEGTLTTHLARHIEQWAARQRPRHRVRTIGIDVSGSAIEKAGNRGDRPESLQFLHLDADPSEWFEKLEREHGVRWECAALVCLGHTWFHLDQESILRAVRRYRPAVLAIDIYHAWDSTIEWLRKHPDSEMMEFGRPLREKGATYWLRTCLDPDSGAGAVQRGVWSVPALGSAEHAGGSWLYSCTVQAALTSKSLFGDPEDKRNIFEESRRQGMITGEITDGEHGRKTGCDYIARKVFRHPSGWGEMQCHVLVPRNQRAVIMNEAYFHCVSAVVRRLFVEQGGHEGRRLRDLLKLFDEEKIWANARGFSGSREAMIVLPFDPHTNFARAIGLFPGAPDKDISRYDLIMEVPKEEQFRFPTAYGLFHTMEDRVSSPQAFPLAWATNYEYEPIDRAFGKLENALLGLPDPDTSSVEEVSPRDQEPGYFLLPIYFGSLPLFALALRFPVLFSPESTDYQVYLSTFANLHAEIKISLTDQFIRNALLSPWLAEVCARLESPSEKAGAAESLDVVLDDLETALFGRPSPPDTAAVPLRASPHQIGDQQRTGGVVGKDWKSWLAGIPSYPIKRLRSIEAENRRLWDNWAEEKERIRMNHELRLSRWFEHGRFFDDVSGEGHDDWLCQTHLKRLHCMFVLAGIPVGDMENDTGARWLGAACDAASKSDGARGYFARSRGHFLFRWMVRELQALFQAGRRCEGRRTNCTLGNPPDCTRNAIYKNLKAVFCKSLANRGPAVRFGLRRLHCLLRAAGGESVSLSPDVDELDQLQDHSPRLESVYWNPIDPSMDFAEFVDALRRLLGETPGYGLTLAILCDEPQENSAASVKIQVGIGRRISKSRGGADCDRLAKAFDKVRIYTRTADVFEIDRFDFEFAVEATAQGIELSSQNHP